MIKIIVSCEKQDSSSWAIMAECFVNIIVNTHLPNDLMLNQWLNKKNNLSVFRFHIRGAKNFCLQ